MNAAMEGRWDHGGPWEDGKITGLLMVMGATGSRPVSSGMKPLAGTFPAAPLPSTPRTHVRTCVRGVHRLVGPVLYPSCRREKTCRGLGMHHAGLPRDAATDPTRQPSGFLTGQT